jgi:hypothetical protein
VRRVRVSPAPHACSNGTDVDGRRSEYQLLPLLDVDELASLASSSTPPTGLSTPLPEDPHELMLVRLAFELSERQRFDDEKKELGTMKTKLVKENQAAKERLEAVEKQMDDFLTVSRILSSSEMVGLTLGSCRTRGRFRPRCKGRDEGVVVSKSLFVPLHRLAVYHCTLHHPHPRHRTSESRPFRRKLSNRLRNQVSSSPPRLTLDLPRCVE